MKIETTITNQNTNDINKMIAKHYISDSDKIKVAAAFGQALSKQEFQEPTEYYEFLKHFEKHISKLI